MTNVRERLFEIFSDLKHEGFTQVKIAQALGITQGAISAYIRGDSQISPPVASLIEIHFGYRKEWILNGELPKKTDDTKILGEAARIAKLGRDLDQLPEIRDLLGDIKKLKKDDYEFLITIIKKFVRK